MSNKKYIDDDLFKKHKGEAIDQVAEHISNKKNLIINGGYGVGKSSIIDRAITKSIQNEKITKRGIRLFNPNALSRKKLEIDVMKISGTEFENSNFIKHFSFKGKLLYTFKHYWTTIIKFGFPITLAYYMIAVTVPMWSNRGGVEENVKYMLDLSNIPSVFLWFLPIMLLLLIFLSIGFMWLFFAKRKVIVISEINFLGEKQKEHLNTLIWKIRQYYPNDIYVLESSNSIDENIINKLHCVVIDVDYGDKNLSYSNLKEKVEVEIKVVVKAISDEYPQMKDYIGAIHSNHELLVMNFTEEIRYIFNQFSYREFENVNNEFVRFFKLLKGEVNYYHFIVVRYLLLYEQGFFNFLKMKLDDYFFDGVSKNDEMLITKLLQSYIKEFDGKLNRHQSKQIIETSHLTSREEAKKLDSHLREVYESIKSLTYIPENSEYYKPVELRWKQLDALKTDEHFLNTRIKEYNNFKMAINDANKIRFSFGDERYRNNYLRLSHWDYLDFNLISDFIGNLKDDKQISSQFKFLDEMSRKKLDMNLLNFKNITLDQKLNFINEINKLWTVNSNSFFDNVLNIENAIKDGYIEYELPIVAVIKKIYNSIPLNERNAFFKKLENEKGDNGIQLRIIFAKHFVEFLNQSNDYTNFIYYWTLKPNEFINMWLFQEQSVSEEQLIKLWPDAFIPQVTLKIDEQNIKLVNEYKLMTKYIENKWDKLIQLHLARFNKAEPYNASNLIYVINWDLLLELKVDQVWFDSFVQRVISYTPSHNVWIQSYNQPSFIQSMYDVHWNQINPYDSITLCHRAVVK